jgi:hypothetical protein
MVSFVKSSPILLPFLTVYLHESGTRKVISGSVDSISVSSQWNLTIQREPVHDKIVFIYQFV